MSERPDNHVVDPHSASLRSAPLPRSTGERKGAAAAPALLQPGFLSPVERGRGGLRSKPEWGSNCFRESACDGRAFTGGGGSGEARDGGGDFHRDPFPDRAPLDHVPVWPERRQPFGFRWRDLLLLGSIAVLGIAALAGCWPW